MSVAWGSSARQRLRLWPLYAALRTADALAGRPAAAASTRAARAAATAATLARGVTVIIPERDAPLMLADALDSALAAAAVIDEPCQFVVVANGAPRRTYDALRERLPAVEWVHVEQPLGFSAAIATGLARARHPWSYLMNNDVTLAPDALVAVLQQRASDVFAVGSQIFQRSASGRREETGFVDWYEGPSGAQAFHAEPRDDTVRPHLAASGGAALFRTLELRRYVAGTRAFDPFYYEDLEWGVRAWQEGWRVLFCPASHAHHRHRATTARFYAEADLARIVERNRVLFAVRNVRTMEPDALMQRICELPYATQRELAGPGVAAAAFAHRWRTRRAVAAPLSPPRLVPPTGASYVDIPPQSYCYRLRTIDPRNLRPRVLVAAPFAIFPARHGGARRVAGLLAQLCRNHDVILVGDEASLYDARSFVHFDGLCAVRLLQRDDAATAGARPLAERMHAHLHPAFVAAVRDAIDHHRPALVQVEHVELADLVQLRSDGQRWVLDLHDAYGADDFDAPDAARRFATQTLPAYDAVTVCSQEDAALVRHARVVVVQNGSSVASAQYRPSAGATLLFLGPFRYAPNLHGIRAFLRDAYPAIRARCPQVSLVVLGGDEAPAVVSADPLFAQPGVRVLAHREDVASMLADCTLTINPLTAIRGSPVKVVESLTAGRACVTTADGARGFVAAMRGLVVVGSVAGMADAIVRLLGDEAWRHAVERPDCASLAAFQWAACARPLEALYSNLLGAP